MDQRAKSNRATIEIKPSEETFAEVVDELNLKSFAFGTGDSEYVKFNINFSELQDKASVHEWLAARIAPGSLKSSR